MIHPWRPSAVTSNFFNSFVNYILVLVRCLQLLHYCSCCVPAFNKLLCESMFKAVKENGLICTSAVDWVSFISTGGLL